MNQRYICRSIIEMMLPLLAKTIQFSNRGAYLAFGSILKPQYFFGLITIDQYFSFDRFRYYFCLL